MEVNQAGWSLQVNSRMTLALSDYFAPNFRPTSSPYTNDEDNIIAIDYSGVVVMMWSEEG